MARPAQAQLDFLFTETVAGGTITGEIEGLTLNATSTPTAIIIFTQPAGYALGPSSLLASGYTFYGGDDTFTVNNAGQITAADVGLYTAIAGGFQGYGFDVTEPALGLANANGIFEANGGGVINMSNANTGGFSGVTYTPVPEPRETMVLFLLAGLGLIWARKLRWPKAVQVSGLT